MVNDGGPVFPKIDTEAADRDFGQDYSRIYSYGRMSLRDYFAGQALMGLLASGDSLVAFERYAVCAFHHADAMLAARDKEQA